VLLAGLTLIFLIAVVTLTGLGAFSGVSLDPMVLGALFVTLIPTTIGGCSAAVGIAGMDRLLKVNVLATSGRAVEAAGDVDTLLLDKTGTITFGNRMAVEVDPGPGRARRAALRGRADGLARRRDAGRPLDRRARPQPGRGLPRSGGCNRSSPSAPQTRQSGLDHDGKSWRKGAVECGDQARSISARRQVPAETEPPGGRPHRPLRAARRSAVSENGALVGVIHLKDVVKPGVKERFADLRRMGVRTVMITGDNPVTAAAIASEAGVDDFLAEATPEDKLRLIRDRAGQGPARRHVRRRRQRRPCARPGRCRRRHADRCPGRARGRQHGRSRQRPDQGHRDRRGRQAIADHARRAHHLLDRQRRREVFRHHPGACSSSRCRQLGALNVMGLASPQSAILSAVIFNALIIVALIPLALKGVRYRAIGAAKLLLGATCIYGIGGI
jgi:K+-transporting ATPase ATPase B chain